VGGWRTRKMGVLLLFSLLQVGRKYMKGQFTEMPGEAV
jgi:hypothetical protein